MVKFDLHTHSTSSDGRYDPSEIIKMAYSNNVDYIALTDHDTISGLSCAYLKAKELNVNFIPGIELSTEHNNESIHILGFFKDNSYTSKDLIAFLDSIKKKRISRAAEIIYRLEKYHNIKLDLNKVLSNGKDTIARPHIAKAIIDAGYPYDNNYIFSNIIGDKCAAYVPSSKLSTKDGIDLLKKYNAYVFLAHPVLIKKTPVYDLIKLGFDGIEALYFRNKKGDTKRFISLAKELNLFISGGSDFHGIPNDVDHGSVGDVFYPDNIDLNPLIQWIQYINIK
ncbi:PHP domain-containing protein [Clostridium carnis]